MGGIYVEIMKDVSFGIAPLTKSDAQQMIAKLKFSPVLLASEEPATGR